MTKVFLNGIPDHRFAQDDSTGAMVAITMSHHEIHEGCSFSCHYTQTVSDIGDKSIIAFRTGNTTKIAHIIMTVACSGGADAYILEAPTVTNDTGATLTVFNRYRASTTKSTIYDTSPATDLLGSATYFTEVTMGNVTGGTQIEYIPIIAGSGPKPVGGLARGSEEWMLKVNTQYAFVVNSLTNDDNIMWMQLDWYEQTRLK